MDEPAVEELALWERALQEQRGAEAALAAARKKRNHALIHELIPHVQALRTKADLLLAEAVMVMCMSRDQSMITDWMSTTGPQDVVDDEGQMNRSSNCDEPPSGA